jgi:oxygen-independent coproporphyrinogen-3 oxidase
MKLGIYIHVPFCRKKCDYCSFYSEPLEYASETGRAALARYCSRLTHEAALRLGAPGRRQIDTVYFGGGTASLLEPEQIRALLGSLAGLAEIDAGAEITLELNPEDAAADKVSAFRDAGVTRAVLGVQTLDEVLHRCIGRSTGLCGTEVLDGFFSVSGLDHCADLIAGIPGQDEESLLRDIDELCSRGLRHLSLYLLSLEKGTPLAARVGATPELESAQRRIFEAAMAALPERGLRHYEISNFARSGSESRHNMKYWKFQPYLGLGAGAHSFMDNTRTINGMSAREYCGDGDFRYETDLRDGNAAAVEFLMTGLRLIEGISLKEIERAAGIGLPAPVFDALGILEAKGHVSLRRTGDDLIVALTGEGIFFADRVIYEIVESLL